MLCGSMTCLHAQQEQQKKEASGTAPKKKKLHGDRMFNLDVLAGIDHPMGDMTKRFGTSYRLGLGLKIKTQIGKSVV